MRKLSLFAVMFAILTMVACNKDEDTDDDGTGDVTPTTESKLLVNEVMTKVKDNGVFYVDPAGDNADWAELYNAGDAEINIAGYFVTDKGEDAVEGDFFEIPTGHDALTTIAAGGRFMIVFGAADANGVDLEGFINDTLFAPMGLSTSKDIAVGIYDADKKFITASADFSETGEFGILEDDKSLGRESDGAATWKVWEVATPNAENK